MRLDDYARRDGKRVWLNTSEMARLVEQADHAEQRIAFTLGGRVGLRRSEIVSVTPNDFAHAPDGFIRVWGDYSKREKYRETPIPGTFESYVRGVSEAQEPDEPLVSVVGSTVLRWVQRAAESLHNETGDPGWSFLDCHDLRRSWGGHLLWNCGVSPMSVMEFGGWEDWQTFKRHYMGEMTPEAMERERSKIDFVGGEPREEEVVFEPSSPAAQQVFGD